MCNRAFYSIFQPFSEDRKFRKISIHINDHLSWSFHKRHERKLHKVKKFTLVLQDYDFLAKDFREFPAEIPHIRDVTDVLSSCTKLEELTITSREFENFSMIKLLISAIRTENLSKLTVDGGEEDPFHMRWSIFRMGGLKVMMRFLARSDM